MINVSYMMYIYMSMMMIWLVVYLPLWKIWKSSWDDDIPNIWKVIKFMFQAIVLYQPEKMSVESQWFKGIEIWIFM